MSNKKPIVLSPLKKQLISEVFNVFDIDGDGQLNYVEFKSACKALDCQTSKSEIVKIIKSYQRTGVKENCIEFSDFVDVLTDKILKKSPEENLNRAFSLFAGEKKDFIDFEGLKKIALEVGEEISDELLTDMITEFDLDGDGRINREEFQMVMTNPDF